MDVFIACVCSLFGVIFACGLITTLIAFLSGSLKEEDKIMIPCLLTAFTISLALIVWTINANENRWEDPANTITNYYNIELKDNQPYYFNSENIPTAIYGDAKFIDAKKFRVKETKKIGGWSYLMYVTGSISITYVQKEN